VVFRFGLSQRKRKHKRKHMKKGKFRSLRLCLRVRLCLRQGRFHGEIRIAVLGVAPTTPVKTRLDRRATDIEYYKHPHRLLRTLVGAEGCATSLRSA